MISFFSDGGFSKMLWIILTFLVSITALIVFAIEVIEGQTINPYIITILSGVLAHAFTIGGSANTASQIETQQLTASKAMAVAVTTKEEEKP